MCLCAITLGNLLECWLCENVNLVLLWMSSMLGTRWQDMAVFFERTIESNKCEKVNFLQIRHFFQRKHLAKQWSYCIVIATLSCKRWIAMWFASAPKMISQTKKPYFDPWEDLFKLSASAPASEFCEWVLFGINVYPHHKSQVKPHSSPWFSAACAAIFHRNHS